jgi:hypothetical protein
MTGNLTSKRYNHAAVYVDQATGYGYIYLQKSISEEETLQGKDAFERHCQTYNVLIQHYHADNGIFASNAWRKSCVDRRQGLTFAGVNAHHQNGIAERRIKELQDMARTMLIHAQQRWPDAISTNLWPYAIRMANDAINAAPSAKLEGNNTPLAVFSGSQVATNPKHWHHFGCPAYVLKEALQGSTGIFHKWNDRSKLGVYLGRSPMHAKNVALILSLETGLVSPQFHCKLDSSFQTLQELGTQLPKSKWQLKAGFVHDGTSYNAKYAPRD